MKETAVFVYGTLRRGGSNHYLLSNCTFIGHARTKKRYLMRASSIPFVSDAQEVSIIHGEVYLLNDEKMKVLDRLESYYPHSPETSWYEREEVEVVLNHTERSCQAQMYFNRKENMAPIYASGDFFNSEDRSHKEKSMYYFAYGSNKNPNRMRTERGICFSERSLAVLKGYRRVFNKRSSCGKTAYANIEVSESESVEGVLYQVPLSAMNLLDGYEGAPHHYLRKQKFVETEGHRVLAEVYLAHPDWIQEGLKPSKEYLAHCNYGL
ncbi:MAG: gamma-glutamylcyclotransferase [Flavobacteriales bacterium]|nr:gamma-glutamylcyclotransferase [Flavobacteriales bacterium]MDG1765451.1 gamma-glutamylcyclotransferase [Flavobacteriales bacterium]